MQDILIIGAGPAGCKAAIRARQLGLSVTLVERRDLGGTCLNRGCIPTKTLLASAELFAEIKNAAAFGITCSDATFDLEKIFARKNAIVEKLRAALAAQAEKSGVTFMHGVARFVSEHVVEIADPDGATSSVEASNIIIATGSEPVALPIPGSEFTVNSDSVLAEPSAAQSIIIVGGGVIGCELATFFSALGREVTIVEAASRILATLDRDAASYLGMSLKKSGVKIITGAKVSGFDKNVVRYELGGASTELRADMIVVSVGRRAAIDGLDLDKIGVKTGRGIEVDGDFRTSVSGIYAVGDVSSRVQLAHVAEAQAVNVVEKIAGVSPSVDLSIIPSCVYTNPEIAAVGITDGLDRNTYAIGKSMLGANGKALVVEAPPGFVKIAAEKSTGRIVGALLVCPRATDMVAELALAMVKHLTIEDIISTVHPHPTLSESIRLAAIAARAAR